MICIYHKKIGKIWCVAATENESVVATTFATSEGDVLKSLLAGLPYNAPFQMADETSQFSQRLLSAMGGILRGEEVLVDFELEMKHVSDYSRKVLGCVYKVPVGYVTTYKAVADAVGGSPRAVGRVMATNPFPPIVPCHRVVCSDFTLGGFGGGFGTGVKMKKEILEREDRGYRKPTGIKVNGKDLALFPVGFLRKD